MRFRCAVVLASLLGLYAGGVASQGDDKKPMDDPLARLAPFVGEWHVEGKWSNGDPLKARGVYEWGVGKKIISAKIFVTDKGKEYQRYESIMAWHPEKKSLYEITFSFDGSISEVLLDAKEKDAIHIGFTPFNKEKPDKLRQILRFTDKDHFVWTVSLQQGEQWTQIIEATWVQKKPAK